MTSRPVPDSRDPAARRRLLLPASAAAAVALLVLALTAGLAAPDGDTSAGPAAGFATIVQPDIEADLQALAGPALEGRDSPSAGLSRAADYIAERLRQAGLKGAGEGGVNPVGAAIASAIDDALGRPGAVTRGRIRAPAQRQGDARTKP